MMLGSHVHAIFRNQPADAERANALTWPCIEFTHLPRLVSLRSVAGLGSSRVGGYRGRQQPVEAVQVCCRI